MARFEVTVSEMQNAATKISQAANDFLNAASQTFSAAQQLAESWEGGSPGQGRWWVRPRSAAPRGGKAPASG